MNKGMGDGGQLPPNMQIDSQSAAKQTKSFYFYVKIRSPQAKFFYEFLSQYNRVSEMCFNHCVHDFTTRKVLESENNCAVTCLEKFLKSVSRISLRFQEIQLQSQGGATPPLAATDPRKK